MKRKVWTVVCGFWFLILFGNNFALENESKAIEKQIESAIYKRVDFFGSQAIVPVPTLAAYENLSELADSNNTRVYELLADVCEKLGKFDEAETNLTKAANLAGLIDFYHRRANYEKEAESLEKLFAETKSPDILAQLIQTAQLHQLDKYLQPVYFQQIADQNSDALPIIEKLIDKLVAENQTSKALEFIRKYKANFSAKMLEKEVSLLSPKEAEHVYYQSFNPFWTDEQTENFYQFLHQNNRYRLFGSELKAKFKKHSDDYQIAIRLMHYQIYDGKDIKPIALKIQRLKQNWNADELVTVARFLLMDGEGDLAGKFLYTLYVRNELDKKSESHGKILYQIFKLLFEAENERLSLTKGDLSFYRDVAAADNHPGITTGILSLIFSDTNPGSRFIEKEQAATKFFNRAAAYRIFQNYKDEFPASPELAQMYLDLIQIYTKAKDVERAEKLLEEFAGRYANAEEFPRFALKLADAFAVVEKPEKEVEVLQNVLDFLGKEGKFLSTEKAVEKNEPQNYYPNQRKNYVDLLGNQSQEITYQSVLARFIAVLAKKKGSANLLEIYSIEIAKYPDQEWLYEERLNWLEQTNLFDEQFRYYKSALEKFSGESWRDKLARWFIRHKKQTEFEQYSADLVEKLNDAEVSKYLSDFIDSDMNHFDRQFYLKLYRTAHQRFPHNIKFVNGLLQFYKAHNQIDDWRKLSAEYYFFSSVVRVNFLNELAKSGELNMFLNRSEGENEAVQLFRADAFLRLSRYEDALPVVRHLNRIYPNHIEFSERLINLTRSFGQKNRQMLIESASFANERADFEPSNAAYRTSSGEIYAELGDYKTAKTEWQKLIETAAGLNETYLETASVFWDYFLYDDALKTIRQLRLKLNDETLYAFEAGAILESEQKPNEAVLEYIKSLANDDGKARRRLKKLAQDGKLFAQIQTVFYTNNNNERAVLHYAELLRDLEKTDEAENILRQEIAQNSNKVFLESAKHFSNKAEEFALLRLADISLNPKEIIARKLELADFYQENRQPNEAKKILTNLVKKFPNNFGVITESANVFWSLGASSQAVKVLQNALLRSRGTYRTAIASVLSTRLVSLNRFAEAEQILGQLIQANPADADAFRQLANVFVQLGKTENLQRSLAQTVKAIKLQDIEPKEVDAEIAKIRVEMIAAFTHLKDYNSAIEQHIEIINREPEIGEHLDNAILYVKRYGGGDLLLKYYQKTADEAFKNYRWNVILARIFEANNDAENAVKNYRKAIDNQPEMTELYAELVRIETIRKNYREALTQLDNIIELSGEEKNVLKQKIQLLQLLGRNEEAQIEKEKLPAELEIKPKTENLFAEADKSKSIEMFRKAFENLLEKPLEAEIKAENITSYIKIMRDEENLDAITERLFLLREKLILEIEQKDSTLTAEAKRRLQTLDNAISQTVGQVAKSVGTEEELSNLHTALDRKIADTSKDEQNSSLTFLQDFAARAGFGDLAEKVLIKRGNKQSLIDFYNQRGAYEKVLEIAETENNLPLIAEYAQLVNNPEKELNALRQIFKDKNASQSKVHRYLQIIDKNEIASLVKQTSPHQLQLINFLLGKGERELAHEAIENSAFQKSWKLSRHAETSLALKELDELSECYFCDALKLGTIGELINQQPDKTQQLIGSEWFLLSREYGEWLDHKKEIDADKFLVSMTENLPKDANRQAKLGNYYFEKNELEKAVRHFQLSIELNEDNTQVTAKLGETLWRLGEKREADELFAKVLKKDSLTYLQTLTNIKLQRQAQLKIFPILVEKLKNEEPVDELLLPIADSFATDKEKAAYFLKLCQESGKQELVETLIDRDLIAKDFRQPFYEILVKSNNFDNNNYEFAELSRRTFSNEDAEEIYDHENDFKLEEELTLNHRQSYLEFLLENGKNKEAKTFIEKTENNLKGKSPRPLWLRLVHFQVFGGSLQKIVGIEVTDNVKVVKLPNTERLNEAVTLLKKLKRETEADKLTLDFYSRMIELEQYGTANFVGLAKHYLKLGDIEKAWQTLQKMIDFNGINTLKNAAEICEEFNQTEKEKEFRQKIAEISPNDFENKFELAKFLDKNDAVEALQNLVNERKLPRNLRWKTRLKLREIGEISELPINVFDAYSQFYNGVLFNDETYLLNSLIADNTLETFQLQQLMKIYIQAEKPFSAFKLAEFDKTSKNEELLDLLSKSAEKIGEFQKAIEFESVKPKFDEEKINGLKLKEAEKNQHAADLVVDAENVRKL